jgi:hypothetical protein
LQHEHGGTQSAYVFDAMLFMVLLPHASFSSTELPKFAAALNRKIERNSFKNSKNEGAKTRMKIARIHPKDGAFEKRLLSCGVYRGIEAKPTGATSEGA